MSQPRGDNWNAVLAHRPVEQRGATAQRFEGAGVGAETVAAVLADAGDSLFAASRAGDFAEAHGGALGAALLAAEVSCLAAHLNSRASAVRALAVDALLDDYSAVAVATALGVSRQKVYDIGRGGSSTPFIDRVPWRQS